MKKLLKLKTLGLEKVFYIFATWNFINVVSHITSFYIPFISVGIDYWFYGIEIVLFSFLSLNIKRMKCKKFNSFYHLLNLYVLFDIVEVLYINISSIIALSIAMKVCIEFFIFFLLFDSAIEDGELKHIGDNIYSLKRIKFFWKLIYISILIGLWGIADTKKLFFLYLIYFLVLCRFACSIYGSYMIKGLLEFHGPINKYYYFKPFYELMELKNPELIKKTFKWFVTVIIAVFVIGNGIGLYKINKFSNHEDFFDKDGVISESIQDIYDFRQESKEVYTYSINNGFSEQSMFFQEKYGIVNVKTGFDSGAIYDGRPCFDSDGISPDYNGHFINLDGEIVFDLPPVIAKSNSTRQALLNMFLYVIYDIDTPYNGNLYHHGDFGDRSDYDYYESIDGLVLSGDFYGYVYEGVDKKEIDIHYFDQGIGFYYSEMSNAFGVISDKGKVLTKPIYDEIGIQDGHKIIGVHIKNGEYNVIDSDLNYLIDQNLHDVSIQKIYHEQERIFYNYYDKDLGNKFYWVKEIDFQGNSAVDYWSRLENNSFGYYYWMYKHIGDKTSIVIFNQGNEILETDKYEQIADIVEEENYFIAVDKFGNYKFTSLNGDTLFGGSYSKYEKEDEGKFFLKSADEGHLGEAVIADIKGNIKYTGYTFCDDYYNNYHTYKKGCLAVTKTVKKDYIYILYNWIDLDGKLLYDWYLDRGEAVDYHYDEDSDEVVLTYIADINDEGETYIHWFDLSGNEVLTFRYYGVQKYDYYTEDLYGSDICKDKTNLEYLDKRVFWVQNEKGTLNFYNEKGEYIGTEESSYDYIYREPME